MGKGSTQFQHLVQTEVPPKLLEEWLAMWSERNDSPGKLSVSLRPHRAGSQLLELAVLGRRRRRRPPTSSSTPIQDRRGRSILSVRDQNTFDIALRRKRLMTLAAALPAHRYRVDSVHYVTPTEDNHAQAERMKARGIFQRRERRGGADHRRGRERGARRAALAPDRTALAALIAGA